MSKRLNGPAPKYCQMYEGVGKRGESLYPAFPYTSFTKISREDVLAIKAYLFSLPPVNQRSPENRVAFPVCAEDFITLGRCCNRSAGAAAIVMDGSAQVQDEDLILWRSRTLLAFLFLPQESRCVPKDDF
jgi:hypothetical protein